MQSQVIEGFQLSPQQKRLWPVQQSHPALCSRCALRLAGPLEPAAVRGALERVVARHEILRTGFERLPGMDAPIQVVAESPAVAWELVDLSGAPPAEREAEVAARFAVEAEIPFAFDRPPLLRATLVRLEDRAHVLLLSLPALCADARSLANLCREIESESGASADGEEAEAPLQYIEFSEWRHSLLEEPEAAQGVEHWSRRRGAGAEPPVLPEERTAEPEARFQPTLAPVFLEAGVPARLDALAQACGATVPAVLLAAWQALLLRLSGNRDLTVQARVDGRKYPELQAGVGLFEQFLPVAVRLDDDPAFSDLVQRAAKGLEEAETWQEYFTEEDDDASLPVAFEAAERFPGGEIRSCTSLFKLKLSCVQEDEGWSAGIWYDAALYEADAVDRLGERLAALLADAVERPEAALSDLELLSAAERRRLLVEWNDTAAPAPRDRCLHELFEERVERSPEAVALSFGGLELTFREVERRTNRLARRLWRLGVGPEVRVALCAERSLEALLGALAIFKAGGVYVPLDPGQPAERLAFLLADAGARVVLTHERLAGSLPLSTASGAQVVHLEDLCQEEAEERVSSGVTSTNLAYIIYTSGSTGLPKGAMIPHASVANLTAALEKAVYAAHPGPLRLAVNAPLAFDASVKQLIQIVHGHALLMVPEEVRLDSAELLQWVRRERVDVLDCTPSLLRLLLDAGLTAGLTTDTAPYPSLVLVGGEAIDSTLWDALAAAPAPAFHNVYGPTECTVDATAWRVAPGEPVLGRPIPNVRVHVLDEQGRLAPIGVPGELCVGGAGVGRGYADRPGLTADRFRPDPFGGEPGARLYRTGDLARWRPDGTLEFLGRIDHQVKLRGYRIELGEIEAVLGSHPAVGEAVVLVREDTPGDRRLVAYTVPRRDTAASQDGVPRYRLPNGMVVAHQNRNETEYLYHEIFENGLYLRYGLELPAGACVFDVGANIGMFTLFASRLRPDCRIYAFEPIRPIFEALRINAERYGAHVRLFPYGLSDSEKAAHFSYYPRYSMMSGLSEYSDPDGEVRVIKSFLSNELASGSGAAAALLESADELLAGRFEQEVQECQLRRLSDVIREEGVTRIHLLKVDVQRAELDVLRGLDEEDWARIDQVVMEAHDAEDGPSQGRLEAILELLRSHGFEALAEQDELLAGTDRYNVYALRPRPGRRLRPADSTASLPPSIHERVADSGELTAGDLREFLRRKLPEYMVPADFVTLDTLPLTRNGKVDRAALPAPEEAAGNVAGHERPRTQVEEVLAHLWAELLGFERVGIEADFFDLGGHSLLATQLVAQVRQTLQAEVPLRSLFDAPTVKEFAVLVEEAMLSATAAAPPIVPIPRDRPLPLSFGQQALWLLYRLAPSSPLYNNPFALDLTGTLDPALLRATLGEVVRRHEVLRTVFQETAAEPVQVVQHHTVPELPLVDLTALPAARRGAEADRLTAAEAEAPFDLERGPVLRARLLRLGAEQHRLLFTLHHIVCDGWSISVLKRELNAVHAALAAGRPVALPELPIQYADYAAWQRDWLSGNVLEEQLAVWRRRLEGAPAVLELPTDRPRPAVPRHRGNVRLLRLSPALSAALRVLGRRERVSTYMTLLAAFQLLLGRWSGQEDVSVGSPIAGRNRAETEGLVGYFINSLVMRTDLSGGPSFRELLRRVREVTLEAHAHQDLPFELLVEELQPERQGRINPLFQVSLVLQNVPQGELELAGVELESMAGGNGLAKLDLTLHCVDAEDQIGGSLTFDTDLFDATTALRLLAHLETLLAGVAADPERRLSELPWLTEAERHQLLRDWNDTTEGFGTGETLHQLFEVQAARTPEATAVELDGERWSYRELDARANRLAWALLRTGVGPDAVVGLCAEASLDRVAAVLGILKAGGAFLPLDPAHPAERLGWMLEDSGATALIAQRSVLSSLPVTAVPCLLLDDPAIDTEEPVSPGLDADPRQLAYVIYTSGSTGRPKGVMVPHSAICNRLLWALRQYRLNAGDAFLQKAAFSFDVSVWETFAPWTAGGRLVLTHAQQAADAAYLVRTIREHGVTFAHFVPSLLRHFLSEPGVESCTSLRQVFSGGEALTADLRDRFVALFDAPLDNEYGPTEICIDCTWMSYRRGREEGESRVSLGRPIGNLRVHILDQSWQPVPVGVAGELCVGGAGPVRGYLGRPDLTADRFVPDPFSTAGERLYRTGDLARFLADGTLEFLGRIDHQVKLRGVRIELGEIEAVLGEHPRVRVAVAVVREDGGEEPRLVAYVVCDGAPPPVQELQELVRRRLPETMMPAAFVPLDRLPLGANGKLDRGALPAPERAAAERASYIAPRYPVELQVCRIWEELLGVSPVGVRDSFFELGGHSLLALRLFSRIEQTFGHRLDLPALFRQPTVEFVASQLRHQPESRRSASLVELQPGGPERPLFLIHPSGGDVFCYMPLARHLGDARPVYGLQARGLYEDVPPLATVEAMAAAYLEEVEAADPAGPYLLGGWSLGGTIAFEMARQLEQRGKQVSLLALIDTVAPRPFEEDPLFDVRLLLMFARGLGLRHLFPDDEDALKAFDFERGLELLLEPAREAGLFPSDTELRDVVRVFEINRVSSLAGDRYQGGSYGGKIHLFRAAERGESRPVPRDWSEIAGGGAEVREVPGSHLEMVREPRVQVLAHELRACCDAVGK